jgi:cyclooctatin synthase
VRPDPVDQEFRIGTAPGRLPLIGHLGSMARQPLKFFDSLREYGDLVELRLGPRRAVMVTHPDLARDVLVDSRTFDKGGPFFDAIRDIVGNGLIISSWAEHRTQRRMVQPAFHRQRLAGYGRIMYDEAAAVLSGWRPGDVVDVTETTHKVAARVVFRSLFSIDADAEVVREVQQALLPFGAGTFRRTMDPTGLYARLPLPANRRFDRILARLKEIIADLVTERRATDEDHGDVLSMLFATRDEETGEGLSDAEVCDQVMNLLMAGTDTSATVLAWTLHLLAQHPDVEQRLHREIDEVLGGRPVEFEDMRRLPYTGQVLNEVVRLFTPVWMLTRVATADTVLGGHRIPAGTDLFLSSYVLLRDPRYFADPERFDPDRWLPERAEAIPRHVAMPFGNGSRKCIGQDFAVIEMTMVLATIAARWRMRAIPGRKTKPRTLGVLTPGSLRMVAEPRTAPLDSSPSRCVG